MKEDVLDTKEVLAALPMYDFGPTRPAADRFWSAVRESIVQELPNVVNVPDKLGQPVDYWAHWRHTDLLFSQTCGYPYISGLHTQVKLIGVPDYGVVPEQPGWYCSEIVVHKDDKRCQLSDYQGAHFACNGRDSQSGCFSMMFSIFSQLGKVTLFDRCSLTGSHAASVEQVAGGHADIAAIDAITWSFLQRYLPASQQLRVLERTAPAPGLPYICSQNKDAEMMFNAVGKGIACLSTTDQQTLGFSGIKRCCTEDYQLIAKRAEQCACVLDMHTF